jgi:hypothetical protein
MTTMKMTTMTMTTMTMITRMTYYHNNKSKTHLSIFHSSKNDDDDNMFPTKTTTAMAIS